MAPDLLNAGPGCAEVGAAPPVRLRCFARTLPLAAVQRTALSPELALASASCRLVAPRRRATLPMRWRRGLRGARVCFTVDALAPLSNGNGGRENRCRTSRKAAYRPFIGSGMQLSCPSISRPGHARSSGALAQTQRHGGLDATFWCELLFGKLRTAECLSPRVSDRGAGSPVQIAIADSPPAARLPLARIDTRPPRSAGPDWRQFGEVIAHHDRCRYCCAGWVAILTVSLMVPGP